MDTNFDNTFNSLLSLFQLLAGEGWLQIMYASVDGVGIDKQPIKDYNPRNILLYIILVYFGSIIIFNLFAGVVIDNYKKIKEELLGFSMLSNEHIEWVEIQRILQRKKLKIKIPFPKTYFKITCHNIAKNPIFEIIILLCILINLILAGAIHEGNSASMSLMINIISYTLLFIYHIEFLIKFYGNGLFYFSDIWNK